MNGVVFTTDGSQGKRMWWSNGSVTTSIWQAPWFQVPLHPICEPIHNLVLIRRRALW